jgi:integrase
MDFRASAPLTCTDSAQWSVAMAFITDKEQLKSGLIIFRHGDVAHRNFYCRIKLPKEDRYKTIALRTADRQAAHDQAFDLDADIRFRIKHDVPVFNRPFRQVAEEYIAVQQRRAKLGEVAADSVKNVANRCRRVLDDYVGSTQIHLIGQDRWSNYPTWRRETGKGRSRDIVSDATIGVEMGAFNAVMSFAISKRYVPASHRFEGKPKLKTMRRDEFTTEEYRKLHSFGRKWIKQATSPQGLWYRTICYNFMLIMCNTGMTASKGDLVHITGRVRQNSYEANGTTHYRVDLIAEGIAILAKKDGGPVEDDNAE